VVAPSLHVDVPVVKVSTTELNVANPDIHVGAKIGVNASYSIQAPSL
jgi:hypothetical protein